MTSQQASNLALLFAQLSTLDYLTERDQDLTLPPAHVVLLEELRAGEFN